MMNKMALFAIFFFISTFLGINCKENKDLTSETIDNNKVKEVKALKQKAEIIELNSDPLREEKSPIELFNVKADSWILKNNIDPAASYFELILDKEIYIDKVVLEQLKGVNKIHELLIQFENPYQKEKQKLSLGIQEGPQVFPLEKAISAKKITVTILRMVNDKIKLKTGLAKLDFYYKKEKINFTLNSKVVEQKQKIIEKPKVEDKTNILDKGQLVKVLNIQASSTKKSKNISAKNIIDNNINTLWIEGQKGEGIKEYIQMDLSDNLDKLRGFAINLSDKKSHRKYNRIKGFSVEIGFSTNRGYQYLPVEEFRAKDQSREQYFKITDNRQSIKGKIKGIFLTFTINSVYFGKNNKDTAVYDIKLYK